jgi:excisionase family DNA binding protein
MKLVLTPRQAAGLIGISVNTIQEWCRDGTNGFPSFKVGKHNKIPHNKLIEWLEEQAEERQTL